MPERDKIHPVDDLCMVSAKLSFLADCLYIASENKHAALTGNALEGLRSFLSEAKHVIDAAVKHFEGEITEGS